MGDLHPCLDCVITLSRAPTANPNKGHPLSIILGNRRKISKSFMGIRFGRTFIVVLFQKSVKCMPRWLYILFTAEKCVCESIYDGMIDLLIHSPLKRTFLFPNNNNANQEMSSCTYVSSHNGWLGWLDSNLVLSETI